MSARSRLIAGAVAILVAACSSAPAPVEDLSARPNRAHALTDDGSYRVREGDTLYSIAFNYGLDWNELARWNGVQRPYTIFPGQALRLAPQPARRTGNTTITTRPAGTAPRASTRPADLPEPAVDTTATAATAETVGEPSTRSSAEPPAKEPPASSPASPAPSSPAPSGPLSTPKTWLWPTDGRVVNRFSSVDPARKGIDIAGDEGQDVLASAAGDVVYSGNGLIGFGELIIIKHSDSMLTAYAHNRVRLVQEGERVAAGHKIAEMGHNHQEQTLLHFELRVDGKPVDPLGYLPSR